MRITSIAVAVIVTASTIPAIAQDFCGNIHRVLSNAEENFEAVKGPRRNSRSSSHTTSLTLPGASECYIRADSSRDNAYWCSWKVDSRRQLRSEVIRFADAISSCLPGSEVDDVFIDDEEPTLYVTYSGIEFYITANNDEVGVDMSVRQDR